MSKAFHKKLKNEFFLKGKEARKNKLLQLYAIQQRNKTKCHKKK